MANVKVVPRSLTEAYKRREGDFSPNLVGLQFTDPNAFFTFGNFQITTNLESKTNKNFALGGEWSDYYSLDNLNLSQNTSEILLSNDILIKLNFDPKNISRYVYFGSFYEYAKAAVESIITKWKGSIYLNPTISNVPVNTVLSFNYNPKNNTANFLIPKSIINNPFQLIVDNNQSFNESQNEIYNIQLYFDKYVIFNGTNSYKVIGYTGSTDTYPYLSVKTEGNPFPSLTGSTFGQFTYHLKPNNLEVDLFFEELTDFENILLNRLTTPAYTSSFDVPAETEGTIYTNKVNLTWPVTDGYNIDINTRDYALYIENLLGLATQFDLFKTDLVSRRFVSESIHEYDTNGGGSEIYGMKVSKLLRIYGREFDEVKKYIDGISFANVVTYDKNDNTSDELIKILAKNLGFDTLLTVTTDDFNLLQQIQSTSNTPFSGYSRSLSAKELDVELWRRLVINAWWLFKSKGTRKVVEFFFNLFNIPQCMITLDEYIYLASNKINLVDLSNTLSTILGISPDLNTYPVDNQGFPRVLPETDDNYFQQGGFWYNGGSDSTTGNNPHIGPYDYGKAYFNQFECFVPNFQIYTTATTNVTIVKNYYNRYNDGTFTPSSNGVTIPTYSKNYGTILNNKKTVIKNGVIDSAGLTKAGTVDAPKYLKDNTNQYSMKIKFTTGSNNLCTLCSSEQEYGTDGITYLKGTNPLKPVDTLLCCQTFWLPKNYKPNTLPSLTDYQCYWCPPADYVKKICSVDDFIVDSQLDDIERLAINLGWSPSTGILPDDFIRSVLSNNFFEEYGCLLITTPDNKPISNESCCNLKGGNWVVDESGKYCTIPATINPGDGTGGGTGGGGTGGTGTGGTGTGGGTTPGGTCDSIVEDHIYYINYTTKPTTPELLSKECCVGNDKYWIVEGELFIVGEQGTLTTTYIDPISLTKNLTNYCSSCPGKLQIKDGVVTIYQDQLSTGQNSNLSETCCNDYGFFYRDNKCYTCSENINLDVDVNVFFDDNLSLSIAEGCCEINGGYYEDSSFAKNDNSIQDTTSFDNFQAYVDSVVGPNTTIPTKLCYGCYPDITLYQKEEVYDITNNFSYFEYKDNNGNPLSESCCKYYANKNNLSYVNATSGAAIPEKTKVIYDKAIGSTQTTGILNICRSYS